MMVSADWQVTDSEGKELQDSVTGRGGGYRYFGAAKSLPGVRELFEKEPPKKVLPECGLGVRRAVWKAAQHQRLGQCGDSNA